MLNYKSPTIKISSEVKSELDKLKIHKRQSYDEVIMKLIKKDGEIDK